jgi:GDP-L-fucose synthase
LSTCVYPDEKFVTYPLTESQLHNGPPHESNFGYAYAKRMLDIQARTYRKQFGHNFISVIPNNMYGPNDNYDLACAHVIPSLIRRFYEAKLNNHDTVTVWGSGKVEREFTFSKDAAKIILWLADHYNDEMPVNIGNTQSIKIADLAEMIALCVGFQGKIDFDKSKPEGQLKKPSSNDYLKSLGWAGEYTQLEQGLSETVQFFMDNYPNIRGVAK